MFDGQPAGVHAANIGADRHLTFHRPYSYTTQQTGKEGMMADSVYKVITLVGTSTESWEKAAAAAVEQATKSLRDLRVAEVEQLDMTMENGKIMSYRAKLRISFKYEGK